MPSDAVIGNEYSQLTESASCPGQSIFLRSENEKFGSEGEEKGKHVY